MNGWNLLRACFWLLAFVVAVAMTETLIALAGCVWITAVAGRESLGSCQQMGATIREILGELVTAILALIVANRPPS